MTEGDYSCINCGEIDTANVTTDSEKSYKCKQCGGNVIEVK